MAAESRFDTRSGNTVLTSPPSDYAMGGEQRWFTLSEGPERGKKMYFSDQQLGRSAADQPTLLFVHGNPESSYTYRKIIADLHATPPADGVRIVAPDHIGFGLSDQAIHEMIDQDHSANLIQLVEALDLTNICLVVHDWGGPIGIGALLLHAPERVRSLLVLNTTVFPIPDDGHTYTNYPIPYAFPWARTGKVIPDSLWGTHAAFAVGSTPMPYVQLAAQYAAFLASHRSGKLPASAPPELAVFRDQFASRANTRSSKRMVMQTPVWGWGYQYKDPTRGWQSNRAYYRAIQDAITPTWGPDGQDIAVAAIAGGWDPLGKDSVLAQWQEALPQLSGNVEVFDEHGHFIEEAEPAEIAAAIQWLLRAA